MNRASNDSLFINIIDLKTRLVKENNGVLPIGILNTDFEILNYRLGEVENGGLTYDDENQLFTQITGRPPFYTMHTTVIAPLDKAISGNSIPYKIHQDYWF